MKRLSTKIFRNIMLVTTVMSLAMLVLLVTVVYHIFSDEYTESLQKDVALISDAVYIGGAALLEDSEFVHRVTLVDADGTVIFDSDRELTQLDNHLEMEEISEAMSTGSGYSERYSDTIEKKTVNIAVKLNSGMVLRISDTHFTPFTVIANSFWAIVAVFVIEMGISMLLALKVSKSITAPINRLDLEARNGNEVYTELTPLVEKIKNQNDQITKQMTDLKAEHKKQDALRSEFTANVSHELKTPLTSISGYAELIKTGIAREQDVERFAGKIYDESQRLVTLVGDIIKLSQLDGREIPVKAERIDLYELCEAVISQLELAARENNITFNLKGEHLCITAAEQIVEEIIFNLCDNAVKYNRKNGTVTVSLKQCIDGIELSVKDTGIGIPADELDRIFERFYRVDKSHSKEIGGTGLGLSIVKHGVAFLGASVSVESEQGKGTVIRIVF